MDDRINKVLEQINTKIDNLELKTYYEERRQGLIECRDLIVSAFAENDSATVRDKRLAEIKAEIKTIKSEIPDDDDEAFNSGWRRVINLNHEALSLIGIE